jgi:hypothetical protein
METLKDLLEWHIEQTAELEGEEGEGANLQLHRQAVAILREISKA